MTADLKPLLDFATELAYDAGRVTLGYFGRDAEGLGLEQKSDATPVTLADREAEALIRRRVGLRYPEHAVVGEEFGADDKDATHRWIVDPIDGTKAFVRGVPLYAVLIGLEVEGRTEVGAAYFPALGEMCAAATGLGCTLNGRPARVSKASSLGESTVGFTDIASFKKYGRAEAWGRLEAASYDRRGWSDAYGHMLVATGRMEAMCDPIMSPWDCGPFPVILREAGGYFGDWSGNETIYGNEGLSTTRALMPEVLELLRGWQA